MIPWDEDAGDLAQQFLRKLKKLDVVCSISTVEVIGDVARQHQKVHPLLEHEISNGLMNRGKASCVGGSPVTERHHVDVRGVGQGVDHPRLNPVETTGSRALDAVPPKDCVVELLIESYLIIDVASLDVSSEVRHVLRHH